MFYLLRSGLLAIIGIKSMRRESYSSQLPHSPHYGHHLECDLGMAKSSASLSSRRRRLEMNNYFKLLR